MRCVCLHVSVMYPIKLLAVSARPCYVGAQTETCIASCARLVCVYMVCLHLVCVCAWSVYTCVCTCAYLVCVYLCLPDLRVPVCTWVYYLCVPGLYVPRLLYIPWYALVTRWGFPWCTNLVPMRAVAYASVKLNSSDGIATQSDRWVKFPWRTADG